MKFLITNDDGIGAPGLDLLVRVFSELGDVTVIAPEEELSGCGHRVTTGSPIHVQNVGQDYKVSGTPADCVRLGLLELATDTDWVISGVNPGGNLGVDVYMSGTVAAAREAAYFGKPAVAFSRYRNSRDPVAWPALANPVRRVFDSLCKTPKEPGVFWNVNLPDRNEYSSEIEIVSCPLESAHLQFFYENVDGLFQFRGDYQNRPRQPGTDVDICFSGNIAVTHLSIGSQPHT